MIKRIGLVLVWGLVVGNLSAQNFEWAKKGKAVENYSKIAVDRIGNSYVSSGFPDTCTFGSLSVTTYGDKDVFLCKYNSGGIVQWLQHAGGTSWDISGDVCVDVSGNVYITGYFIGPVTFGSIVSSDTGLFIAKYDPTGSVIWVQKIDSLQAYNVVMAISESGKIAVAGTLNSGSKNIVCLDTSGTFLWTNSFTATYFMDIAFDKSDNIYLTGAFINLATFGTTILNSLAGNQDIYLAKCNANGSWAWALQEGSTDLDQGLAIDIDAFSHIYITGFFELNSTFGCGSLTSTGSRDIFIASYDTAGNCIWLQQAGGGLGAQYGFALSSDNYGNCIITGSIIDTTHFGSFTLFPNGENMYVAKYDSTGICAWAVESTGMSGDRATGIGTDSTGNIYVTGSMWTQGIHTFGNFQLNAVYYNLTQTCDIFTAKINNLGTGIPNLQSPTSNFQIFPNPATSTIQLTFNIKHNAPLMCEIWNVMGERVYQSQILNPKSQINLDVSFLAKGMYVVRVGDGVSWEHKKLVVE